MTAQELFILYLEHRSIRSDLKWSGYTPDEYEAAMIWYRCQMDVIADLWVIPSEDDYVARIEAGESIKAEVLA